MKNIIKTLLLTTAFISLNSAYGQEQNPAAVQKMVESKNFVFKAQSVLPQRGSMRQLTSEYDLRLLGDSVVSYLPFFGRAFVAPVGPDDNGLKFTSTDFTYTTKKKKQGWEITILPKDTRDVRQLFLSVYKNGYARLQVISNNRDGIAYNGYIEALKENK